MKKYFFFWTKYLIKISCRPPSCASGATTHLYIINVACLVTMSDNKLYLSVLNLSLSNENITFAYLVDIFESIRSLSGLSTNAVVVSIDISELALPLELTMYTKQNKILHHLVLVKLHGRNFSNDNTKS